MVEQRALAGAGTARARVIILALMQPELASTPTTLPPRLKLWAVATRWLLALLLFCALLLGLGWALLHWMIVPRIDEFRPALQNLARQATGLQIEIGQLQARSSGLMPSFELSQVSLLDTQGQPALRLPRVLVAISPRSVAKLGLEQLVIEGAELELRRTRDGRLVLAGIDMSAAPQMEIQPALDWLFSQTEWALRGGLVRWHDELQNVRVELRQVDWVMRNSGQRHQMRLDATPDPQWGDRFSLRGLMRQPLLSGGRATGVAGTVSCTPSSAASKPLRYRPMPAWPASSSRRAGARYAAGWTCKKGASSASWPMCSYKSSGPRPGPSCHRLDSSRCRGVWAGSRWTAACKPAPRA